MEIIFEQEDEYVEHEPCLHVLTLLTLAHALEPPTRKAAHDAFEFQCQQHRRCAIRRQAAAQTQGVEVEWIEAQRGQQGIFFRSSIARAGEGTTLANCATELFENVLAVFRELGTLLEQQMASLRERRMDGTGNCENLATLLQGMARSDQRAAHERGFYHEAAARQSADQAIPAGKVRSQCGCAQRELGYQGAFVGQPVCQIAIACRIDDVESGTDYGD